MMAPATVSRIRLSIVVFLSRLFLVCFVGSWHLRSQRSLQVALLALAALPAALNRQRRRFVRRRLSLQQGFGQTSDIRVGIAGEAPGYFFCLRPVAKRLQREQPD